MARKPTAAAAAAALRVLPQLRAVAVAVVPVTTRKGLPVLTPLAEVACILHLLEVLGPLAAQTLLYLPPLAVGEHRRLVFRFLVEIPFKAPLGAEVVEDLTAQELRKLAQVVADHL